MGKKATPKYDIVVVKDHYALRIYISGIPHVCIQRDLLGPFQAWRDGPQHYSIEFYLRNGSQFKTEYDCPFKWKLILDGLDREIIK